MQGISNLLECPFCESNNQKQIISVNRISESEWKTDGCYIECECGARSGKEETLNNAVARWNRDYEYFIKRDGTPNLFKVKFIAYTKGYSGYKGEEQYSFEAENMEDARHWVINHLDCSCKWNIREL